MNMPEVRRRLPDGSHGPLELVFPEVPENIDHNLLIVLQAMAGMQEQIMMQQEEIERLKGGAE